MCICVTHKCAVSGSELEIVHLLQRIISVNYWQVVESSWVRRVTKLDMLKLIFKIKDLDIEGWVKLISCCRSDLFLETATTFAHLSHLQLKRLIHYPTGN